MIGGGNTLGRFMARLGMDESDYTRGIINAAGMSRVFGDTFATFVTNPLLGSIDILKNVGSWLVRNSVDTLAYAEAIERLSQQTGASQPLLVALQKQLELAGFDKERARQAFLVFNKFIDDVNKGGPLANDVLSQLRINLDETSGFDQIFRVIIERLSQIEDPATKAGIAMKLFGEEAGHDVINAIGGGNAAIDEMIDRYERLGFITDNYSTNQLATLNTNLGIAQQAIDGIKLNFIRELLVGINDDLDLTNDGIVKITESINEKAGPAANDIGTILSGLGGTLEVIAKAIETIQAAGEEVFTLWYRLDDWSGDFFDPGPDAQVRAAQARNRELGQEYLAEMGP